MGDVGVQENVVTEGVMNDVNLQDIVVEWEDTEPQEQADYAHE